MLASRRGIFKFITRYDKTQKSQVLQVEGVLASRRGIFKFITRYDKTQSILQDNFDLFFDFISFQHVLHYDVGRSKIELNMKLKMVILVFT